MLINDPVFWVYLIAGSLGIPLLVSLVRQALGLQPSGVRDIDSENPDRDWGRLPPQVQSVALAQNPAAAPPLAPTDQVIVQQEAARLAAAHAVEEAQERRNWWRYMRWALNALLILIVIGAIAWVVSLFAAASGPLGWISDAHRSVTSMIPDFNTPGPASPPPAYCGPAQAARGLCPPGSAPSLPSTPATPAPIAAPSPGTAAGTVTVCDKNRKETLEDYQLIAGGITLNLFNPLRCKSSFVVKSGTIRITYRDNSQRDFTPTTCPAGTKDPGCTFTVPPVAIASVTPSSIITLVVEPVR